jgi:hypothetical protein
MGKPYSDDLRERVVAAIEAGHTRAKVGGIIKHKRETGSVSPDKFGGYKTFMAPLSHTQIGLRSL